MKTDIFIGNCLDVLKTLPEESVQTVITSPPYWGLRDYGTATWTGGDPDCDHDTSAMKDRPELYGPPASWGTRAGTPTPGDCPICGAVREDVQIGLEATPDEHVAVMVAVFREVRRVLRKDGTLWLNYGDSYAGTNCGGGSPVDQRDPKYGRKDKGYDIRGRAKGTKKRKTASGGLKAKDLVGMPWRVALALQADGWWLRSEIIWAKPNPVPESCTDRPTKSHEHLFLLSRAPKYFYDHEAVKEPSANAGTVVKLGPKSLSKRQATGAGTDMHGNALADTYKVKEFRNRRDVWFIPTQSFPGAHFATFPTALVEPCIKAGTSERGCCPECRAPLRRIIKASGGTIGESWHDHSDDMGKGNVMKVPGDKEPYKRETTGWETTCDCDAGKPVPCVVLDPFGGAGTVAVVAQQLRRDSQLVELNKNYAGMAKTRIHNQKFVSKVEVHEME